VGNPEGVPDVPDPVTSVPPETDDDLVALLPHRPPFRFVDVVDECEPGSAVTARWRITGDEPWLAGHFPGNPIVPGVLQIEALAQAGAIGVLADPVHAGRLPVLGGVEDARFRRMARPGDEITLHVALEKVTRRGGWGRGTASVDGEETATGRILFLFAPG
jgi:3-hydroxyacyl-[acyl-carrier-protein] dehydratase